MELKSTGDNKIAVIKAVREVTGLGLADAKGKVDTAPQVLKEGASKEEAETMNRTPQHSIIWPFIHGFMILALVKEGKIDKAKEQFEKWNQLVGFHEFYDPKTGKGGGSRDQLWSACLYIRCFNAISGKL